MPLAHLHGGPYDGSLLEVDLHDGVIEITATSTIAGRGKARSTAVYRPNADGSFRYVGMGEFA